MSARGKPDGGGVSGDGWPTGPALVHNLAQTWAKGRRLVLAFALGWGLKPTNIIGTSMKAKVTGHGPDALSEHKGEAPVTKAPVTRLWLVRLGRHGEEEARLLASRRS
jgi:hypothetical protein